MNLLHLTNEITVVTVALQIGSVQDQKQHVILPKNPSAFEPFGSRALETLHSPALRAGASVVQDDISFVSSILGIP